MGHDRLSYIVYSSTMNLELEKGIYFLYVFHTLTFTLTHMCPPKDLFPTCPGGLDAGQFSKDFIAALGNSVLPDLENLVRSGGERFHT